MSKIKIDLFWKLDKGKLLPGKYSNQHEIALVVATNSVGITWGKRFENKYQFLFKQEIKNKRFII